MLRRLTMTAAAFALLCVPAIAPAMAHDSHSYGGGYGGSSFAPQPYTYSSGHSPAARYTPPAGYRVAPSPRRYPSYRSGNSYRAPAASRRYSAPTLPRFGSRYGHSYGSNYGYGGGQVYGRAVQPLYPSQSPRSFGGVVSSIPPTESFNFGYSGGATFGNDEEGVINGWSYRNSDN